MRVGESWRSNESESCNSHPLSSSFDQAFILYYCHIFSFNSFLHRIESRRLIVVPTNTSLHAIYRNCRSHNVVTRLSKPQTFKPQTFVRIIPVAYSLQPMTCHLQSPCLLEHYCFLHSSLLLIL